jgi:hypothetical protein
MMLAKCNCYSLDRRIDELGEHNERLRDLLSDAIDICDAGDAPRHVEARRLRS